MHPTPLSRTSSVASISSSDDPGLSTGPLTVSRRTRKRFTNVQLTILEDAFHQNSHPSRDQREALAKQGGMETKSVTIWFQNKRQTERKVAMNNANNPARSNNSQTSSSPLTGRSASSRPSLDSVASRSELRMAPPRTPTRKSDSTAPLWENMPSSPVAPVSPPLGKSKRTLEWACAAARHSDKNGVASSRRRRVHKEKERTESTDEDMDAIITPSGTLGAEDIRWTTQPDGRLTAYPEGVQDDDMMKAALTLCGLGRYSRS